MNENDKYRLLKTKPNRSKGGLAVNYDRAEGSSTLVGYTARGREDASNALHLNERVRPGLFLGQVKFIDPIGGGRVKVWIPEFSPSDDESDIDSIGDSRLITCIPLLPFGGVSTTGKGFDGRGTSYGFWARPQEQSWVGVMFPDQNIGMGVYIGGVPSLTGSTGFPSAPGVKHDGAAGSDCPLPSTEEPFLEPGTASSDNDLARNIVASGLVHDPIRGPSQSGADKVTSTVIGFKSPGDPGAGKLGHQIYMDDDGAYQGIRLRTSAGNQITMSDSAGAIYMASDKSKSWVELTADGDIFMHAARSVSIHAEEDFRIHAGRDFIVEAGRDAIRKVAGSETGEIAGTSSVSVKGEVKRLFESDVTTWTKGKDQRRVDGDVLLKGANIRHEAAAEHSTKATGDIKRHSTATIRDQGGAPSAGVADAAPTKVKVKSLPGPPTEAQQKDGKQGDPVEYAVGADENGMVPQREPWRPTVQKASAAAPKASLSADGVPYKDIVNDKDGPVGNYNDRSVRNNNPGNITGAPRSAIYAGEMPEEMASVKQMEEFTSGTHRVYRNPEYGFAAQTQLLQGHGYRGNSETQTVRTVSNRWVTGSPSGTPPAGYAEDVAAQIGVDPDDPVAWDDYDFMFKMQKGIAKRESDGFATGAFNDGQLTRGMALAGMQPGAAYAPETASLPAPAVPAKAPAIPTNNTAGTPTENKTAPVRGPELSADCGFSPHYLQAAGGAGSTSGNRTGFRSQSNIEYIFVHCTATPPSMDIGVAEISAWHRARGWNTCGYHKVIRRSGSVERGRDDEVVGDHVGDSFANTGSLAVSLAGGNTEDGLEWPNYEDAQLSSLKRVIQEWLAKWPKAVVLGHYNVSRSKSCPVFDASTWYKTGKIIPVLRGRSQALRGFKGDVLRNPGTIQEGVLVSS